MRTLGYTFILAVALALLWHFRPTPPPVQVPATTTSDSLTMIYAILTGDKKECKLLNYWPEAPIVMLEAARKYKIDHCLLPTISRTEGPTPAMLRACNIYGLERRGKLIKYNSHSIGTDSAAVLLAKHKSKYHTDGLVDVEKLAVIWCPLNAELWTNNVKNIYLKSLR